MKQRAPAGFEPLVESNVRFVLERESRSAGAASAALDTSTPGAATDAPSAATTAPVVAPTMAAAAAAAATSAPPAPTVAALLPENEHTTRALLSLQVTRPISVGDMLIAEPF